ncbi:MAG: competence protein CoiA family protein [Aerococcaceae bacterium]|nr:competence protein CoiA family protein [Aerococcaceae bacterium]
MYAALTQAGEWIYAAQASTTHHTFLCPKCHQPVKLKQSHKGTWYFAHQTACQKIAHPKRDYAETEWHQAAKRLFYQEGRRIGIDVKCEHWFDKIQQAADIYLPQQQLVIECQHSPISAKQLKQRTNGYRQCGVKVIWLMDANNKQTLSTWHKTMLHSQQGNYFWRMLDVPNKKVHIFSELPLFYRKGCAHYQYDCVTVADWLKNQGALLEGKQKIERNAPVTKSYERQLQQIRRQTIYQRSIGALYEKGILLQQLPKWILTDEWQCLLLKMPCWEFFAWIYAVMNSMKQPFTANEIKRQLKEVPFIKTIDAPFIEGDKWHTLVQAALSVFHHYQLVVPIGFETWQMIPKSV